MASRQVSDGVRSLPGITHAKEALMCLARLNGSRGRLRLPRGAFRS